MTNVAGELSGWGNTVRGHTPAYVYSLPRIAENVARVTTALEGAHIAYSMKANPLRDIVAACASYGLQTEVASLGEFEYAMEIGVPPEDILMAGPGKTKSLLARAMTSGLGVLHAESREEFLAARELRQQYGAKTVIAVRLNTKTGVDQTGENMTGGPSRFGVDEESLVSWGEGERSSIDGFHLYQASQVRDWRQVARSIEWLREFSQSALGRMPSYLNYGGGFGIQLNEEQEPFDLQALSSWWEDNRLPEAEGVREYFELGRYLVADAGALFLEVLAVKQSRDQGFVITDGGMNCFLRPVLTSEAHRILPLDSAEIADHPTAIVTGPLCTPLDVVGRISADPRPGELLAVLDAGAYGLSLSPTHFLGHETPSEWVVAEKKGVPHMKRRKVRAAEYLASGYIGDKNALT